MRREPRFLTVESQLRTKESELPTMKLQLPATESQLWSAVVKLLTMESHLLPANLQFPAPATDNSRQVFRNPSVCARRPLLV